MDKLHQAAKNGPVATSVPRLREYPTYWLTEMIKPNRAPLTYVNSHHHRVELTLRTTRRRQQLRRNRPLLPRHTT